MHSFIAGGEACSDFFRAVADLIGILGPIMQRQGVATAAGVDVAMLAKRLKPEALANGSVIVGRSEVGPSTRL
jgi:hypothetical protein